MSENQNTEGVSHLEHLTFSEEDSAALQQAADHLGISVEELIIRAAKAAISQ